MSMCHSECKPQSEISKAWEPDQEIPERERERERERIHNCHLKRGCSINPKLLRMNCSYDSHIKNLCPFH
jgi:hypothetical protein